MRRCFGFVAGVLLSAVVGSSGGERPNIILLMADDLSPRWFSAYGEQEGVHTPNIDRMIHEGVGFKTAWCTPMCSPTRALVMTGQYGMRTGWLHNKLQVPFENGSIDPLKNGSKTFAHVLKEAGYKTAFTGRWGIPSDWRVGKKDYHEHFIQVGNSGVFKNHPIDGAAVGAFIEDDPDNLKLRFELDPEKYNGRTEAYVRVESMQGYGFGPYLSRYWNPCIVKNEKLVMTREEDFGPDLYTDFLIDFARRHKEEPFLVYYPMFLTHGTALKHLKGVSKLPSTPLTGRPGDIKGGNMKECALYCDLVVGRIMKALEAEGLADSTILIFTSDNADAGGPGAVHAAKTHATDNGARVPLAIWGPGLIKKRGMTDELFEFSDFLVTFADFAAAALPDQPLDGQSAKAFLTGAKDTHRDWIASYIGTARMVRNKRYLIEGADPHCGDPAGKFSDCGDNRSGLGYRRTDPDSSPEARDAYAKLVSVLKSLPEIDYARSGSEEVLAKYKALPEVKRHRLP